MFTEDADIETDYHLILICAFRYALGRRTYVVDSIVKAIHNEWGALNENDKELMVREILEYKSRFGQIGDVFDEDAWMSIVDRHRSEH